MNYVKSCLIITMLLGIQIGYSQCDANGDGELDVLDVVIEVDCILTDCWEGESVCEGVEDTDGNCYETIQIGEQLWMAENLKVTHYNNGDEITYPNEEEWGNDEGSGPYSYKGQNCVYDNDPANADVYGNLYNWYAVDDDRGVCPTSWHVPSDEEWTILTDYLGGESVAGGKMKEAGLDHWNSPNTGATNESGFTCLPAGYRDPMGSDSYFAMGNAGYFWSSSEENTGTHYAYSRSLGYGGSNVYKFTGEKHMGFSIRCLGD